MASTMMHLYVGKRFKDKHGKIKDTEQFYLGCVYPDCVNAFGFASAEVRWPAHLRTKDINEWYENNRLFYRSNTGDINEDFLLGHVIHNITDAAYDEHFNKMIDRKDWQRFAQEQGTKDWWTEDVLPVLRNVLLRTDILEINGVSEAYVKTHLEWILSEGRLESSDEEPICLTTNVMDKLSEIVHELIADFIK